MIGLGYIRKQKFMSLQDVANIIKVTKQTVGKWENEVSIIPKNRLKQLAELFNIEEEYLTKKICSDIKPLDNETIKQDVDKMNLLNEQIIIKEVIPNNALIIDEKHKKLYDKFDILVNNVDSKVLEDTLNSLIKLSKIKEE